MQYLPGYDDLECDYERYIYEVLDRIAEEDIYEVDELEDDVFDERPTQVFVGFKDGHPIEMEDEDE
jgi:hypothetical protein